MGVLSRLSLQNTFSESKGYYERVPIRVGDFVLKENKEGRLNFETTSQEFCKDGPEIRIIVSNKDGWHVNRIQGSYHSTLVPSVDLHSEKLGRRRAFWHAAQYMSGKKLSHRKRFSITHTRHTEDPSLFRDDAFFKNDDAVTTDPFGKFLK
jgi:hypothetical protein